MSDESNDGAVKNRRRHTRVTLAGQNPSALTIIGATAQYGQSLLSVFDISHTGAAIGRPSALSLPVGEVIGMQFQLADKPAFHLNTEVIWVSEEMLGVLFVDVTAEAREAIDGFLSDLLIGAHLRLVDKHYYAPELDCDYWYYGPKDTSVQLWLGAGNIEKCVVELDAQVFVIENSRVTLGGVFESKANEAQYARRVLGLLSQIPDRSPAMEALIIDLAEMAKGEL